MFCSIDTCTKTLLYKACQLYSAPPPLPHPHPITVTTQLNFGENMLIIVMGYNLLQLVKQVGSLKQAAMLTFKIVL